MRKLLLLLVAVFATSITFSQTVLISPTGDGGFETGSTFSANGWTVVNNVSTTVSNYFVGSAGTVSAGSSAAYISSDNGTTNSGSTTASVVHFYRDITFPAGESVIKLTFKYKQATLDGTFDFLKVYATSTSAIPVAGTQISTYNYQSAETPISASASFQTFTFNLPSSFAGTTQRIVFSWKNDAASPYTFSTIDEISLTSALPGNIVSTGTGGLWSAPATWVGGVIPTATDNVTIADGTTVTIDVAAATAAQCLNLTVGQGTSGILQYQATPAAGLTVNSGIITVAANGNFNAGSGTLFTHALNIGGTSATGALPSTIVNNGTLDLNGTAGAIATFYGAQDGTISGSGTTTDFYAITVNKGATQTGAMVDVTSVITIGAPTTSTVPRLTVTTGTLRISSATVATPYFGNQTICAASGRLWLNNASASLQCVGTGTTTGGGAPTVTGELRIDNGTFGYGSGNNVLTFTSGSGVLRMSGGTLNIYGAVSFPSSSSTQLLLSGGAINVDAQAGNSLAVATSLFSIGASTTVTWSAGTITIVDPHAATAGTAWTATTGGTKTITGGTLYIGDGTSTSASGATANTNGFGLLSTMPVYNLVINNRTDASATRLARLTGAVTVNNDLTISANSYLFLGSAAATQTLTVKGNIVQNGILAGCEPGGTQAIGILYINGQSGSQTLSGSGTFVNNSTIALDNSSSAGITFSNANLYKVNRVNLYDGLLNPGSNFTIGNSSALTGEIPIIQYGGGGTLPSGVFGTFPTLDLTDGPRTLLYSTSGTSFTLGFNGEIGTGTQTITQLLINNATGLTIPATITALNINSTLSMTLGNINLSGTALTLGTSASALGTLSYTTGFIQGGTLTRWFGTTASPTTIANGNGGHFPLGVNGNNRNVWLTFSVVGALSTGGTITVGHTSAGGLSSITGFTDGGVTVDTRTNSSWTITQSGCVLNGANTVTARMQGTNTAVVGAFANLRMIRATDAVGTSSNGTNTAADPQVNRTAMDLTMLANTFYIGAPAADLTSIYTSIVSGNWEDGSTWDIGTAPLIGNTAVIANGHTVTVNTTPAACATLTVNSGGTLNLSSNTLVVGNPSTNNASFTSAGTLTVSNGTLNVNGSFNVTGGVFNQNGGAINVDGTGTTSTTGSLVNLGTATYNLSGGTLTIVDPAVGSSQLAFAYSGTGTVVCTGTHTVQFGDGISTQAGTTGGFILSNSGTRFNFKNLTINGTNLGVNRFVKQSSNSNSVLGSFTINANSEYRESTYSLYLAGDLVNNGILVSDGTTGDALQFMNVSTGFLLPVTNAQTVSGSGAFNNSTTSPTAYATVMVANNTSTSGVTFAAGLVPSISGSLTITDGKFNADGLILNGSGSSIVLTAATSSANVTNFTLNNAGGGSLSGSGFLNVTGLVSVTSGVLASAGRLVLRSVNATATGTARIASIAAGAITGNVVVQRYILGSGSAFPVNGNSKRGFRFIGHPLTSSIGLSQINAAGGVSVSGTGGATNGFQVTGTNNPSAFWYNPTIAGAGSNTTVGAGASAAADPGWVAFTNTNGTGANAWAKGQGIRFLFRGDQAQGLLSNADYTMNPATVTFTGAINIGPVTTTLASASTGTTAGYNVLGNPLPSPVDLSLTTSRTNMDANFYVFDPSIGNRGGYSAAKPFTTSYILPVGGAFVANVTTLGTAASITFPEASKVSGQTDMLFRNANQGNYLKFRLEGANMFWDELNFEFGDKYKAETEYEDGAKFINSDVNFYSITKDNSRLSLDYRKLKDGETIPLGLVSNQARSLTIKVDDIKLDAGATLYLIDKYLNTQTKLETGVTYDFATTTDAASQGENRFEIGMKQSPAVLPVIASAFSVKLSPNPATDVVKVSFTNVDQANTTISIVNAEGKTVKTVAAGNVQNGQVSINVKGLAKGTYYVTLTNGTEKKTEKLVIQ